LITPSFVYSRSSIEIELLGLSEIAQAHWFKFLIGLGILGFAFSKAKEKSKGFRIALDRLTLRLPIVGQIVYQSIIARYCRTLSTTFAAGVPLIDALTSVAGATGNYIYEQAVFRIRDEASTGTQLNIAMAKTNLFPAMAVQMTTIGEESGALDDMLDKAATYYEEQVDNLVDNLTTLLEPMIMSVLGVLVGGLLIAMYLPIFQIGQAV
jgi:type IV pilus assembly protein PilC